MYNMPIWLRTFYIKKLDEKIKKQNEAEQAAAKGNSPSGGVARGPFGPPTK